MSKATAESLSAVQTDGAPKRFNNSVGGHDLAHQPAVYSDRKPGPDPVADDRLKSPASKSLADGDRDHHAPATAGLGDVNEQMLAALPGALMELATRVDGMGASVAAVSAKMDAFAQRRDGRHLDKLIRTLIGLREEQQKYPQVASLENLANQLGVLLENDCDLTEINPQDLDAFNPVLHRQVAECETADPRKVGRIEETLRVGIMQDGHRYKTYFAEVVLYMAIKPPQVTGKAPH